MKKLYTKIILVVLLVSAVGACAWGQQLSLFNTNLANPFSINPSQAGLVGNQLFFQHRRQWVGVQGAPEKTLFTSEWRLKETRTAVGFSFGHEQSNVIANSSGYATVAQHFDFNEHHMLSFGASVGVRHNSIDFDAVSVLDPDDALLFGSRQNSTNFDSKFGLTYRFKALEVQATALQLFGNTTIYDNSFDLSHLEYRFVRHLVGSVGYRFQAGKSIGIKPIVQVRGIQGSPILPEAIVMVDFKRNLWVAGHYLHNSSAAISVGTAINGKFIFGYSGEILTNNIASYNGGTHELVFGLKLGEVFRKDSEKRTLSDLERQVQTFEERQQYLEEENRRMQEEIALQREKMETIQLNGGNLNYQEVRRMMEDESEKIREELGGPKASPDGYKYYVTVATAKSEIKANKLVALALKEHQLSTFILYPEGGGKYQVCTGGFDDKDAARKELKRVYELKTAKTFGIAPGVVEQ